MANNKKIQAEIDRVLKKTTLCLTEYDEMNSKFKSEPAQNATAKERLMGELKREIKKLQRQRDQIKAFIANSEVKDVKQLESSLKKIEERMEGFRLTERANKTKAFSKEGLSAAAVDTPLAHTISWLKQCIEEGRKRAEILDYEAQKASKGGRRGGKKTEEKIRLDRLRTHIQKWDVLLRMLNNEEVACEDVDPIQAKLEALLAEDCDADELANMDLYESFYMPEGGRGRTDEDDDEEVPDWMEDDGAIDETFGDDTVADDAHGQP
ncbi:CCR4-NOT transcription complex subunit 3 [Strigomonas culicis]|uniref:CCR4-NOT transcription complex subunit 3 n=1 Tax=Strigomonas culicis TaxID=28005 RepID=S9THK3_9TRYP|nr:CCR4-NOT transcription complex subunit 3 [Strigomonas culicis]|eukprot:EPY15813.1 CCR4-NOT transcription complex subunit 3 [Strigomonas culicis]